MRPGEQFGVGLEVRGRGQPLQLSLDREACAQGQGAAAYFEGQRRAPADAGSEAIAGEPYQFGDAFTPGGGAQVGFVGVVLLVETEDVADDRRPFQQGDAGVVRSTVGPGGQFRCGVQGADHGFPEVGVASDAIGDARQSRAVVDAPGKHEGIVDQRIAGHQRLPPWISKRISPRSRWSGSLASSRVSSKPISSTAAPGRPGSGAEKRFMSRLTR
ncbi:hypothetical protein D9M71_256560 [compost metagenome]